jgi:23S rRNA (cytidine2498-2'-O)-methyltransferase
MLERSEHSDTRHRRIAREEQANVATLRPQIRVGDWLWLCRLGAENDVCEELALYRVNGELAQPALVRSPKKPRGEVPLAFARQGIPVSALLLPDAQAIVKAVRGLIKRPVLVHVFAPDSDEGNMLSSRAEGLSEVLVSLLRESGVEILSDGESVLQAGGQLVQVCFLSRDQVAVGVIAAIQAQSVFPGGRQRFRKPKDAPSRSARKLEEALVWSGYSPAPGEVCVDLGAAPGGWSQVLVERRCHVVAIDPGRLAPEIARRVEHLRMNAFGFAPEIPADWVVCDMAYRPLEVAGLLARWGRNRWAQFLIANFKLPMKKRVEMVGRIREILATGGWTGLKVRQLYHDREEVTIAGWRGFGRDTRVPVRSTENDAPTTTATTAATTPRPTQPARDGKPTRNSKPARDGKLTRNSKPARDGKPTRSSKPARDGKPTKNSKPARDGKPAAKRTSPGKAKAGGFGAQPRSGSKTPSPGVRGGRASGKSKGHVRRP